MEYNPYTNHYDELNTILAKLNTSKSAILDELSWYDNTDVEALQQALQDDTHKIELNKSQVASIVDDISTLHARVKETGNHINTMFNPGNWFSSEQKKYRQERRELNKTITSKEKQKQNESSMIETLDRRGKDLESNISKYENFDLQEKKIVLGDLENKISPLQNEFEAVAEQKEKVDVILSPITTEMGEIRSEKRTAKSVIERAKDYQCELSDAGNSYERKKIHQKCEDKLGKDSPGKIIKQQKQTIEYLDRKYLKLKERAIEIGQRAEVARITHTIIIDGNNMCYENGNKYVGLFPLIKATSELKKIYKVTIVFDAAIRSMLKSNDDKIAAQFAKNIAIHVVASRKLADETILDSASGDKGIYIISNDRFGEYKDKEVVKNNRVIRHEILNGRVLISGFDINASYN